MFNHKQVRHCIFVDKGNALEGAVVKVKGAAKSVLADNNGNYAITVPGPDAVLVFSDMRNRIRHERKIELALEGQRYFDLKRWKLDRVVMPTVKDPSGASRTFPLRDTLWPVPQSEMDVANQYGNSNFKQTPGW